MRWLKALGRTLFLIGILVVSSWIGTIVITSIAIVPHLSFLSLVVLFLPVIVSTYLEFLWQKAVKQMKRSWPAWIHWRNGLTLWIVCVVSTSIAFIAMWSMFLFTGGAAFSSAYALGLDPKAVGYALGQWLRENEWIGYYGLFAWFSSAICLYWYDDWALARKHQRKKVTQTKTQKFIPPDPVDVELARMRGDLGLSKVKRMKKRSPSPPKTPKSQKRKSDR